MSPSRARSRPLSGFPRPRGKLTWAGLIVSILAMMLAAYSYLDSPEDVLRPALTGADRRPDKHKLVLATFNGEFLWDGDEPEDGRIPIPQRGNPAKAREHMKKIAEVVRRCRADIVNLIEVEDLTALKTFNREFLQDQGYREYLANGTDTITGQDVGMLTRLDMASFVRDDRKGISGPVNRSVSKDYLALLLLGNLKIVLIGLHFLANPDDPERLDGRQAQAEAVRQMVMEKTREGCEIVVWGDFNDFDFAPDSRDHLGHEPITDVLERIRAADPSNPNDDLVNVARWVPIGDRYTAYWDRNGNGRIDRPQEFSSIDHILLSPGLAKHVESVEILHDHDPREVSDHFPIVVRLDVSRTFSQPGSGDEMPRPRPPVAVAEQPQPGTSGTPNSGVNEPIRVSPEPKTQPQPFPQPQPPNSTTSPSAGPSNGLRMVRILADPEGDDRDSEEITIFNGGLSAVSLKGWTLRDLTSKTWDLGRLGEISPEEEKTARREGQSMALNNDGDTVELVDPNGQVVHRATYGQVTRGQVIIPGK